MLRSRAWAKASRALGSRSTTTVLAVREDGIVLRPAGEDSLEVEIGGHRVWVVKPLRDGRPVPDGRLVPWPRLLKPYLNGWAHVVLRILDGPVLFDERIRLGSGSAEVRVVNKAGDPLTLDKAKHLVHMFDDADQEIRDRLLDTMAQALELLERDGHPAFVAFGCLLGAVRDGRLIGHDNDGDISYLARATHPLDVMLESFQVERAFRDAGWKTRRMSGADFKVFHPDADPERPLGVDVFTAFYLPSEGNGILHIMPNVVAPLPPSTLVPTSTVRLEGRDYPAPADPEAVLLATYGPGWKVPDPAFRYQPPREVRRRLGGLMRGERTMIRHWNELYQTRGPDLPKGPSDFARWVGERERGISSLVDVGAGNGRDSFFFAARGADVVAYDYSKQALKILEDRALAKGIAVQVRGLNLYNVREVLARGALLSRQRQVEVVYARFLVDVLDPARRVNLWRLCRLLLRGSAPTADDVRRVYLEFRVEPGSSGVPERYGFRADPDQVAGELRCHGFSVVHNEVSRGWARLDGDDPLVCRMVAEVERTR